MQIRSLTLTTPALRRLREFYSRTLELPIEAAGETAFTVRVGASRLIFRVSDETTHPYHFAFNIPPDQFDDAKAWLETRVSLITDLASRDEFSLTNWNGRTMYFYDPAGNILECIARYNLPYKAQQPFSSANLLNISEIGVATEDVVATVKRLQTEMGLPLYKSDWDDMFMSIGDEEGLFIVVKAGRIWLPDTGIPARMQALDVQVEAEAQRYHLTGLPYRIDNRALGDQF